MSDEYPTSTKHHTDPAFGQNPYTDPPPIEYRRFHEDPVPRNAVDFATIMQGRGAAAPRPGYEHEQQYVPRPEDTPSGTAVSPSMTVAELFAMPEDQQQAAIEDLKARAAAFAEQRAKLAEEFPTNPDQQREDDFPEHSA